MTFDAGTWWLIGILLTALLGFVGVLVSRTVFKALDKNSEDIETIKQDYTPRTTHDASVEKIQAEIKEMQDKFLTREDFFREQAKTERKLDQILNLLMKGRSE